MKEGRTGDGGDAWNMLLKMRDDADEGKEWPSEKLAVLAALPVSES